MRLLYWLLQLHSSKLYGMMHNAIADAFCKIGDRTELDRLLVTEKPKENETPCFFGEELVILDHLLRLAS